MGWRLGMARRPCPSHRRSSPCCNHSVVVCKSRHNKQQPDSCKAHLCRGLAHSHRAGLARGNSLRRCSLHPQYNFSARTHRDTHTSESCTVTHDTFHLGRSEPTARDLLLSILVDLFGPGQFHLASAIGKLAKHVCVSNLRDVSAATKALHVWTVLSGCTDWKIDYEHQPQHTPTRGSKAHTLSRVVRCVCPGAQSTHFSSSVAKCSRIEITDSTVLQTLSL